MDKIYVVYWSQSGNTQAMAEAIGRGITAAGKEAVVQFVSEASIDGAICKRSGRLRIR